MGDVLLTSVSGLLAFQQALDVTSNNVSNASTPGYSVETANFTPQVGTSTGGGYVGNGVQVQSVTRSYSEVLAGQMRTSQSNYSSSNTYATTAAQVDNMLSDTSSGLTVGLQDFSNALQTLASAPTLTASGQALLSQAQSLAQSIQGYDTQLDQYGAAVETQIGTSVQQINSLASSIASLNTQIADGTASTGQQPNELLDQRDELLDQLSQYVTVNTTTQSDGQMDVYIGSGQALVNGGVAQTLSTIPNQYDAGSSDIGLTTTGTTVDITSTITGGSLGGLLAVRSQVIDPTQNALGQISVAIASIMNQQQAQGLTQTGAQGQPMFAVGGVQVLSSSFNTGGATVSATITNTAALGTDDYVLSDTGGTWQLTDQTTGAAVAMTGSGTSANPFQAAGISIVVSGTAASGDSFLVQPTAAAAAGFSVLLTSPTQIASAAALQTSAGTANTGTGTIAAATVTDPTNAQLLSPVTIQFTSATTYQINGTGPSYTYTSGGAITADGWSTSISGTPQTGDTFTVSSNAGNTGDNSNLLAMISGLSANTLAGGTASLMDTANNLVSQVGTLTQQAQSNASAQLAINQSATDAVNNLSGVNLDEEAANLLSYQQAYQACAQMIQASGQMFDSLITALNDGQQ